MKKIGIIIGIVLLFVIVGFMSLKVAFILLLCVPLIPVSIVVVQKIAKRLLVRYWNSYTGLADSFLENLQGLTTLKYYQSDLNYQDKMDKEAEDFRKKTMRVLIMQLNSISVMDLVAYGGFGLGVILGLQEYLNQHITFMMFIFIVMISIEFFLPLRMLGSYFHIGQNGNAAADKIFKLLDSPDDIQESYQKSIIISIADNGIGLDPKDLPKIFDTFYRADKARSNVSNGSGIGLSVCRRIIEMHGGRIWATGSENTGLTILISLDRRRDEGDEQKNIDC